MHRLKVGGGAVGLFFALGALFIFMTVPEVRWTILLSVPAGGIVGLALWYWHRRRAVDLVSLNLKN